MWMRDYETKRPLPLLLHSPCDIAAPPPKLQAASQALGSIFISFAFLLCLLFYIGLFGVACFFSSVFKKIPAISKVSCLWRCVRLHVQPAICRLLVPEAEAPNATVVVVATVRVSICRVWSCPLC